jgi:hypothetical protein
MTATMAADPASEAAEILQRIEQAERAAQEAEGEVNGLRADLKEAKENLAGRIATVRRLSRSRLESHPLLDQTGQQPEPVNEEWRDKTPEDAGITGKLLEKLIEAGLDTIGKLADYSADGSLLIDLTGIGPAKAEQIENLMADYWAAHPEYCQDGETTVEAADEDEDDDDLEDDLEDEDEQE